MGVVSVQAKTEAVDLSDVLEVAATPFEMGGSLRGEHQHHIGPFLVRYKAVDIQYWDDEYLNDEPFAEVDEPVEDVKYLPGVVEEFGPFEVHFHTETEEFGPYTVHFDAPTVEEFGPFEVHFQKSFDELLLDDAPPAASAEQFGPFSVEFAAPAAAAEEFGPFSVVFG